VRAGGVLAAGSAGVLSAVCDPVIGAGRGRSTLETTIDDEPRAGPLAALVTGAAALRARAYAGPVVLLGVDLPFASERLLRLIADHPSPDTVVPVAGRIRQSCCSR